ncbi:Transposase [Bradyrhizobium erythrophlei]|nr:Transposase [Bradyrhizobium erythrophlei]
MSQIPNTAIAVIGIDIGKNSFHVVGHDARGAIALRQKWSRGQVEARLANMPPCLVGMEACVGAHHLSRKLASLGHDARLMPAKYVRPYSKGQKNDFNDADAIAEAVQRPTMKFVATKTAEQLDLQALHRVRERLVSQRTGIINQIRAFMLERGIAVRQGIGFLRTELPTILATRTDALSPRMLRVIEELTGDWRRLDQRIDGLSGEIEALARQDQACSRLMTVPGIGPIISSAMVAAIGTGDVFLQRPRLRRLARTGAQADLDGRPHDPRQNLEARQSLPARSVRAGGMGCAGQDKELGTLRAQILDRSRQEAIAPQRAGDRARQQACPHRLGGAGQGTRLRADEDRRRRRPTRLILAPCSAPSRRSLATPEPAASQARRPALTAPVRDAIDVLRAGTKERPLARTKELRDMRRER